MKPRFKRYSLILLMFIVLLSAVLLHYAPPPPEEGALVLIHATERGAARIAEEDEQSGPLYDECVADLRSLTPPVEIYVSWEDLSNWMDKEESTYVQLILPEPMDLRHSYHVGGTDSGTIRLRGAVFGLHDPGPYADIDLFVISDAPDPFRTDGGPQVVAYDSERGIGHLSALVNATLQVDGGTSGN